MIRPFLPTVLQQIDVVIPACANHLLRPEAGLNFPDMGLEKVEHAEPGLSDASPNGFW